MPRLSVSDRHELINLHLSGLSNCKTGRRLKCDEKTVRMTVKKHQNTGSVPDAPKSGRPRVNFLQGRQCYQDLWPQKQI